MLQDVVDVHCEGVRTSLRESQASRQAVPPCLNHCRNSMALPVQSHLRILLLLTISSRLFTILLLGLSSFLPQFDSSAQAIPISRWLQPLLRWDAFHFAHVSKQGYLYEHEWAFFPGAPWIMRASAKVLQLLTRSGAPSDWGPFLQGAAIMALACDTPITLYHLSVHHLRSPSVAFIAASLSLLPSSPVTLYLAACSEPFFTCLSYKGEHDVKACGRIY